MGFVSKNAQMKQAFYGFPQIMNKTEASFYLWRNLNLDRLNYLIRIGKIKVAAEDNREVITKKSLDEYIDQLTKRVA